MIAAMQAFGDKLTLETALKAMAPLAILGGSSVSEVVGNIVKGTKLEGLLTNGKGSDHTNDEDDARRSRR